MFKGAIFDIDGVIVDTVPLHFGAWKRMFEEYGHKFSMEDYLAHVDGRPRYEGAAAILTELSEEDVIKAGDKKQGYYLELLDKRNLVQFDSTIKFIKEMKKKGIKLGAASSSKNATMILKKINIYDLFDANVSGNDFKKGKPDPEIFLTAAKRMELDPNDCVVFEDAKSGVEAAVNGKFHCIGINRHDNFEALKKADKIVNDISEITFDEIKSIVERS